MPVEVYGKEIHGDLAEGKRTLMMIHLLQTASPSDRQVGVAFLDGDREYAVSQIFGGSGVNPLVSVLGGTYVRCYELGRGFERPHR